jgi:hypothetical protein
MPVVFGRGGYFMYFPTLGVGEANSNFSSRYSANRGIALAALVALNAIRYTRSS